MTVIGNIEKTHSHLIDNLQKLRGKTLERRDETKNAHTVLKNISVEVPGAENAIKSTVIYQCNFVFKLEFIFLRSMLNAINKCESQLGSILETGISKIAASMKKKRHSEELYSGKRPKLHEIKESLQKYKKLISDSKNALGEATDTMLSVIENIEFWTNKYNDESGTHGEKIDSLETHMDHMVACTFAELAEACISAKLFIEKFEENRDNDEIPELSKEYVEYFLNKILYIHNYVKLFYYPNSKGINFTKDSFFPPLV